MKQTSLFLLLLFFFCVDLSVVQVIHLAQGSLLKLPPSLGTLWGGGAIRASLLAGLALACLPSGSRREGLQSALVLGLHPPAHASLLALLGQPTVEQLWGWHRWDRVGPTFTRILLYFTVEPVCAGETCELLFGFLSGLSN